MLILFWTDRGVAGVAPPKFPAHTVFSQYRSDFFARILKKMLKGFPHGQ